ncbi:MAG: hypothetical protein R6V58_07160 [Planctomycetota bacterium]
MPEQDARRHESERANERRGAELVFIILFGSVLVLAGILFYVYWEQRVRRPRHSVTKIRCKSNLRSLAQAAQTWSVQFGDSGKFYPPSLRELYDTGIVPALQAFFCPATGRRPRRDAKGRWQFETDYECALDLIPGKIPTDQVSDSLTPFAWDKPGNHPDGVVVVVYFDQHIDFISGPNPYERIRRDIEAGLSEELKKKIVWRGALAP